MPNEFGKGLLPDPTDSRDFKVETLGAIPPVDFSLPYQVPDVIFDSQASSDACVSFSFSYYHEQLKGKRFSRRDLFARIAQPYGAYLRDAGLAIVNQGQATRDEVPDPAQPTAQNMRDKTGITAQKEADDKELSSFTVPNDINSVAHAIKQYQGVVFGVTGGEFDPGHALYAVGYHLDNGKRCIMAASSWTNQPGTNKPSIHHINEDFFPGRTMNPWTLVPKGQTMSQVKIAVIHGEAGIFLVASDIPQIVQVGKLFGKEVQLGPDGQTITNADVVV